MVQLRQFVDQPSVVYITIDQIVGRSHEKLYMTENTPLQIITGISTKEAVSNHAIYYVFIKYVLL